MWDPKHSPTTTEDLNKSPYFVPLSLPYRAHRPFSFQLLTMIAMKVCLGLLFLAQATSRALAYTIDTTFTSLSLSDTRTGLPALTLFFDEATDAHIDGLLWKDGLGGNTTQILHYQTFVNGEEVYQGYLALPEDPLALPRSINAGTFYSKERGKTTVEVVFWIDGELDNSVSINVQTFQKWMSTIPMMVICVLGFVSDLHVIYTLMIGLFIGGCMFTGSFIMGFKSIITKYIITVASEEKNVYLYTFSLCVAGLAAMIRRSGGVSAVIKQVSQFSNSIILGQIMVLVAGIILFFDPYASIIFIGELVSPYFRLFPVSLEKYAFLIQTTGVPVAAINPLSTWVGFGSALIQTQLDKLVDMGFDDLTVPDDGWMVFVRSIKYQFYPIFLLCLVPLLILSRRDLGPMLVAERERWLFIESGGVTKWTLREKISRPESEIPRLARNLWVPIGFWSVAVWLAFAFVSDPDSVDNASEFMAALIYCTIGAAVVAQIYYFLQRVEIQENGEATEYGPNHSVVSAFRTMNAPYNRRPSNGGKSGKGRNADFILHSLKASASEESDPGLIGCVVSTEEPDIEEVEAALQQQIPVKTEYKPFVSLKDGAQCFFKGGATVTPVLMTLTLAWATTALFLDLGMDRLFADLINQGNLQVEMFPTVAFFVTFLLALTTGSSIAAQTIVLPLLAVPLYVETEGNAELFYALVGAVFSGSVVGDHASPLSTSSILSSIMIECDLRDHALTQSPYILFVAFLSVLAGHIPSAFEKYPYYIGYAVGFFVMCMFVGFYCVDILNEEGKYDFITSQFVSGRYFKNTRLKDLQERICMANGIEIIEFEEDLALDTESASEAPTYDPEEHSRVNHQIRTQMEDYEESVASADDASSSEEEEWQTYEGRAAAAAVVESNSARSKSRSSRNARSQRSNRSLSKQAKTRTASPSRRTKSSSSRAKSPSTRSRTKSPSTRSRAKNSSTRSRTKSPSTRSRSTKKPVPTAEPEGTKSSTVQAESPSRQGPTPTPKSTSKEPTTNTTLPATASEVQKDLEETQQGLRNNVLQWLGNAIDDEETTYASGADEE